ncbi:MAG: hypothetical protein ACXW35_11160 [Nitrospira sp.]
MCLGDSAAKALFGSGFRPNDAHGQWHAAYGIDRILPTYHPAAALRAQLQASNSGWGLGAQVMVVDVAETLAPGERVVGNTMVIATDSAAQ